SPCMYVEFIARECSSATFRGMSVDKQQLASWKEAALARLLRYVAVDTIARPGQPSPSSPGQITLGAQIADELRAIGLRDVVQDAIGHVMATLPATPGHEGAPVVGYLAH